MSFRDLADVEKSYNVVIFINFRCRNISFYNFAKNAVGIRMRQNDHPFKNSGLNSDYVKIETILTQKSRKQKRTCLLYFIRS